MPTSPRTFVGFSAGLASLAACAISASCTVPMGGGAPPSAPGTLRAEPGDGASGAAERLAMLVDAHGTRDREVFTMDQPFTRPTLPSTESFEPAPQSLEADARRRSSSSSGFRLNQWHLSAFWVPAQWIVVDEDPGDPVPISLDTGMGWGARVGLGDDDQSIGVLFMSTSQDESRTGAQADTYTGYVDFLARGRVWQGGGNSGWVTFSGGLGLASVQWDSIFKDQTDGAAQIRAELDLQIKDTFAINFGIAGFIWGHPGETLAYGSYLSLGGKVMF